MSSQVYDIKTLKDVLELVPDDRIEAFCSELPTVIRAHRAMAAAFTLLGATPPESDGFRWTDDGSDHVNVRLHNSATGEEYGSLRLNGETL